MIDTHAHLLMFEDKEQIVEDMQADGVEAIVTIGTTLQDSKESVEFAKEHKNIYATVGIYPEYSRSTTDADLYQLKQLAMQDKVVAIGEIGLDYHYEGYDSESQKKMFGRQLEIANELGLPFCVHCRDAASDVYDILKNNKHLINHAGLMHCYSEGAEWASKFVELGMYISFSGNITYKKNDVSFIKDIPLDRIVVETDAPYLTPIPYRGKRNYPKYVRHTLEKLAEITGKSYGQIEKITSENARRFYFKMNQK